MSVVAKRYAEAYLSSAAENNSLDAVGSDITDLIQLLSSSDEFSEFVSNPLIEPDVQSKCLDSLFKGKVHELTLRFLQLLVVKERLADVEAILNTAGERWREGQGILPVTVTSAEALSDSQMNALQTKLKARTGKTIELTCLLNPALIGGFQLFFDGKVEDYSLMAKLHTFKRNVLNA